MQTEELKTEGHKFKEITSEGSFLVRALFFLLFGYLLETSEIMNPQTLKWSLAIVFIIFVFRAIQLKLSKMRLMPLLFVAPRGLITILLFLSIGSAHKIYFIDKSLIIQVIIISSLIMMFGLMLTTQRKEKVKEEPLPPDTNHDNNSELISDN